MSPADVAIVVVLAALVLALQVICALKGKWGFLLLGLLIRWFWIFGAVPRQAELLAVSQALSACKARAGRRPLPLE
jgi:hypothetical protein